jgi:hypothetical protein
MTGGGTPPDRPGVGLVGGRPATGRPYPPDEQTRERLLRRRVEWLELDAHAGRRGVTRTLDDARDVAGHVEGGAAVGQQREAAGGAGLLEQLGGHEDAVRRRGPSPPASSIRPGLM